MFSSFFPNPKIFFPAAILWTALSMALWYGFARDLGPSLSVGNLIGFPYPPADAKGSDVAVQVARDLWLYEYMIVVGAIFVGLVGWLQPHRWFRWSVGVSALVIFLLWFQVQLDVMINNWFGTFYNLIQQALAKPYAITQAEFYAQIGHVRRHRDDLHLHRGADDLHHQPLRFPLAHGDERLLRRQLATPAVYRRSLAARPG